jgi:hypothetical protein
MDLYTEIMVAVEKDSAWLPGTREYDKDENGKVIHLPHPRPETELEVELRRKTLIKDFIMEKSHGCTWDEQGEKHAYYGPPQKWNPARKWGIHVDDGWIWISENLSFGELTKIQQGAGYSQLFVHEVIVELNWLGIPTDLACGTKVDFEYWHGLRGSWIPAVVRKLYDLMWDAAEHHVHGVPFEQLDLIASGRADGMYRLWLEKGAHFLATDGMTLGRKVSTVIGRFCIKHGVKIPGVK